MAERTTNYEKLVSGALFTWGVKLNFIQIGKHYQLLRYHPWKSGLTGQGKANLKETLYHVYVDREDTCESCNTLEEAIVAAIAYKAEGPNHRADYYFNKMIQEEK